MSAPEHLKYTASHEWVRREADGTVSVGITEHAQAQLGDVVFVGNPEPGRRVQQGEECGVIESVKAAGDIHAPVSGEIVAANAELPDAPEKINEQPYAAWMFRIRPDDPSQIDALLDAADYLKSVES
ncbi:MAG: glycine cleavage system protein GcvH [Burkholderiales bacterium]|jgi:glycine cleavage system H protein|nr:glycine cleavage system protein GcvH [Burkholderiales bacterium]